MDTSLFLNISSRPFSTSLVGGRSVHLLVGSYVRHFVRLLVPWFLDWLSSACERPPQPF